MKIEKTSNLCVLIYKENGGYIESQSVEANLLFAILDKLEEIRCGLIDVEDAVEVERDSETKYLNKVA